MIKSELRSVYDANHKHYEQVCLEGKCLIENVLKERKIDLLHVSSRVKSFESFYEKISRKKYLDPYKEIEDICGLRVVCFYSNDLKKIDQIIHDTFDLRDFINKAEIQDPDRFGYRANHYIVKLPEFNPPGHFKIEIQVRTILMHAWAHIEGKLEYKKAEHTPKEFKRKLYQLSALLELADSQFQTLKFEKDDLKALLSRADFQFSNSTELNIDTFMAYLDVHFPGRKKSYRYSKLLMKELIYLKISFKEIIESYEKSSADLVEFEVEANVKLRQDEALKIMLCINNQTILDFFSLDQLVKDHMNTIKKWGKLKTA